MPINALEYAKLFMTTLDKQILEQSTTGWMESNAGQVKYSGGNEVKIPSISMSGLGEYDRDEGFVQGSVSLTYETKKLTQDRGRTFQLDAMDVDESNFLATAGTVMGEFQRTKVIPEIDAYRYSTLARLAAENNKTSEYAPLATNILSKLLEDIGAVRDATNSSTDMVISMSVPTLTLLSLAKETPKWVDTGSFAQGSMNLQVKTIDGIPILAVPSARMKTAYTFHDGKAEGQKEGGFAAAADALDINWMITAKNAPIAVSKTDVTRIFDPMTNQKANAWRIDYRKYHDLWLPKSALETVRVSVKPKA